MYREQGQHPISIEDFKLPAEGKLSEDNRWVIMPQFVPWSEFEKEYSSNFSIEMGAPAKPFRMARARINNQREACYPKFSNF